ncbi:hypothetical protein BT96DRAFT_963625 [Gymnopus androsaceus JB14]|uniref:CENP-V/GFA domain-containing protein n=1 Tax=Gymnopus androsaceus JB14 TaxID=1447944 RepID=A0A6A4I5S8_9AGAR|nr:hypothetical protein BT96DRAFT_963625 [Gymnopus androsaceus JB14]
MTSTSKRTIIKIISHLTRFTVIVDKSKSYIPLAGSANDGWSNKEEATATCFCGTVQLKFPTQGPGLVDSFICNCHDCRKITASMFASGFMIDDHYLHPQKRTIQPHEIQPIENHSEQKHSDQLFLSNVRHVDVSCICSEDWTVDDFHLHETKLKPRAEQFVEDRVGWLCAHSTSIDGVVQFHC